MAVFKAVILKGGRNKIPPPKEVALISDSPKRVMALT